MNTSVTVHFHPGSNILSAGRTTVSLLAHRYGDDQAVNDDDGPCIITLDRKFYVKTWNSFLDRKAEYCAGGDYCGVGCIVLDGLDLLPAGAFLMAHTIENPPEDLDIDTDAGMEFIRKQVPVPRYRNTPSTVFEIEMEHG